MGNCAILISSIHQRKKPKHLPASGVALKAEEFSRLTATIIWRLSFRNQPSAWQHFSNFSIIVAKIGNKK